MAILQGVWKQHLSPRAVVGYGVKILLPSPPNYVTRSPGYPRVSPGAHPLAKKPVDSGYEIGVEAEMNRRPKISRAKAQTSDRHFDR